MKTPSVKLTRAELIECLSIEDEFLDALIARKRAIPDELGRFDLIEVTRIILPFSMELLESLEVAQTKLDKAESELKELTERTYAELAKVRREFAQLQRMDKELKARLAEVERKGAQLQRIAEERRSESEDPGDDMPSRPRYKH